MSVAANAGTRARRAWGHTRRLLHAVGLEVHRYPPRDPPAYSLAQQLRELLALVDVAAVVDVGAHVGQFARFVRDDVGFAGPIVSFEPSRVSFCRLVTNLVDDDAWTGHCVALGATPGSAELQVYDSTNLNSLHRSSEVGAAELQMVVRDTEPVEVRRLDGFDLPPGQLLVKTDTQGHDLAVLDGAADLLARTAAIVIEAPVRPLYEDVPVLDDILRRADELGFELSGLYPVLRASDHVHAVEFDALLVPR